MVAQIGFDTAEKEPSKVWQPMTYIDGPAAPAERVSRGQASHRGLADADAGQRRIGGDGGIAGAQPEIWSIFGTFVSKFIMILQYLSQRSRVIQDL